MGIVIGARFPEAIVKKIDMLVASKGYVSRADVVRSFVREGLERRENQAREKSTTRRKNR
jgi:Arc/MetJ-type ribon-helix-helix transcriptional regulator